MKIKIQQWGKSPVIRLNKDILQKINAKVGDIIDIEVSNNTLFLHFDTPKYTLTDLLANSSRSSFFLSDDDKVWLQSTTGKEVP